MIGNVSPGSAGVLSIIICLLTKMEWASATADSYKLEECAPGCALNWLGDGVCEEPCFVLSCSFDDGDCDHAVVPAASVDESHDHCAPGCRSAWLGDGECDPACNNADCRFDIGDCDTEDPLLHFSGELFSVGSDECAPGCPIVWLGDGDCDAACNQAECRFDMGDCDEEARRYDSDDGTNGSPYKDCAPGCLVAWLGNGKCDAPCDNMACNYDVGDCNLTLRK
mmetsp:Transcript_29562/g.52931  ORF Transcript_29562/g.52931 Transcript_29562/m.52931 type:complete len:224 (-) Transcript_29562:201-872(-)